METAWDIFDGDEVPSSVSVRDACSPFLQLFQTYATWSDDEQVGGVSEENVKQLLQDLDVLEGVPAARVTAYVQEVILRADQDQDGVLGLGEFLLWFLSEVAALLPLKRNGMASAAPLYNRFLAYVLLDSGTGIRQRGSGMQTSSFLSLCRDSGLTRDAAVARTAAQLAKSHAVSDRMLGKMEGGTRLQFVQFVQCLQALSISLGLSLEAVLLHVVDGSVPRALPAAASLHRKHAIETIRASCFESEVEQPLAPEAYTCNICNKTHRRWRTANADGLKAYLEQVGIPYLPHLCIVNTHNIRAAFHRYNLRHNKGHLLPASVCTGTCQQPQPDSPSAHSACPSSPTGAGSPRRMGRRSGFDRPCCCQLRSMSVMELQTFWAVVHSSPTVSRCLKGEDRQPLNPYPRDVSGTLTLERVEAAFLKACSIAGVYHRDGSIGMHTLPISPAQAKGLYGSLHGAWGSAARKQQVAYGTPFSSAALTSPHTAGRLVASASSTKLCIKPQPKAWTGSALGSSTPILLARPESVVGDVAHRPPVPTLTFPQFLEALRLLAEDMVGHPQVLASVELALMSILFDVAEAGCPRPCKT